jgi:hypothetical protein
VASPFRDERETALLKVERLERENAALRAELEEALSERPPLPLLSFGFVLALVVAVGGLLVGSLMLLHVLGTYV